MGIVVLATLVFVGVSYVHSYGQLAEQRNFTVSAEGKAIALPDVAEFSFSVITEGGKNLADLQKMNTDKVNAAVDFVKSKGVDKKDIKTTGYSVAPRYEYSSCGVVLVPNGGISRPCPPPNIAGYTISQNVQVKVRDFTTVGDILAGVVAKGANSVSQLSFIVDDETTSMNAARADALMKARAQAEMVAKAGGFQLGKLISVQEGESSLPYGGYSGVSVGLERAAVAPQAVAPQIEPGSNEVKVTESLTYEIN